MREDLYNAIATTVRCAVLRGDLDALLECLESSEELGGVVVLELVEASRECTDIKVALHGNFLEHALARRNIDGNAESLALFCRGVAGEE